MELFEYYLRYMTELLEGKRPAPAGITLTAEDEEGRTRQITEQLALPGVRRTSSGPVPPRTARRCRRASLTATAAWRALRRF